MKTLNEPFKRLRKLGYACRQGIAETHPIPEGKIVITTAYEIRWMKSYKKGYFHIHFNGNGNEIFVILKDAGLNVMWDGVSDRIMYIVNEKDYNYDLEKWNQTHPSEWVSDYEIKIENLPVEGCPMTEENSIEENNRIIAEFDNNCKQSVYLPDYPNKQSYHIGEETFKINELKYSSSWNLLIPVINQIIEKYRQSVMQDSEHELKWENWVKTIQNTLRTSEIGIGNKLEERRTYLAVVRCLKWYNEIK